MPLVFRRHARIADRADFQSFRYWRANSSLKAKGHGLLLGSKIPCGAHEGRGLGRVVPRAYEGDVEEPGVLRRGEPLASLTPRLDQIQQHLASIPIGVAFDRVAEG